MAVHGITDWTDLPQIANRCMIAGEYASKCVCVDRIFIQISTLSGMYVKELRTADAVAFFDGARDIGFLLHRLGKLPKTEWTAHLRVWRKEHRHVALRPEYDRLFAGLPEVRTWIANDTAIVLAEHNAAVARDVSASALTRKVQS